MDWSFASKPGAAPSLMSFRSAAREEPAFPQFSAFDGAKSPAAPRILTHQVGCACGCSSWFWFMSACEIYRDRSAVTMFCRDRSVLRARSTAPCTARSHRSMG